MILNIYFKNVGQGDTLIIDWNEGTNPGDKKFGIIDCNLLNRKIDPVTTHIKDHGIRRFEFALMSHPHSDHFSGFLDFLTYCKDNNIFIKEFFHTAPLDPKYLSTLLKKDIKTKKQFFEEITIAVNYDEHKDLLWNLYEELRTQHKEKDSYIGETYIINAQSKDIVLTDDISIRLLSPTSSYDELELFFNKSYGATADEKLHIFSKYENNPHANYLSSFLQIVDKKRNWQILLCSDTTSYTFDRILANEKIMNDLMINKTLAVQVPHHGSGKNHIKDFWGMLKGIKDAHALISVGNGYGHPDIDVVKFFDKQCKGMHATNFVGGYEDYFLQKFAIKKSNDFKMTMNLPGLYSAVSTVEGKKIKGMPRCCEKQLQVAINGDDEPQCNVIDPIK
jgi:competence protein ComEC